MNTYTHIYNIVGKPTCTVTVHEDCAGMHTFASSSLKKSSNNLASPNILELLVWVSERKNAELELKESTRNEGEIEGKFKV